MRSKARLIAAIALAAMCAPGTMLRTEVPDIVPPPEAISLESVAGPSATPSSEMPLGSCRPAYQPIQYSVGEVGRRHLEGYSPSPASR